MANENMKNKGGTASTGLPLDIAEKKKLLAKLLQQENNNGGDSSFQETVNVEQGAAAAFRSEESNDKSAAQPEAEFRKSPGDEKFNNSADMDSGQEHHQGQNFSKSDSGAHSKGDTPNNPFQDFWNYLSQAPFYAQFLDPQQNPFVNPGANGYSNPMEMFSQWMQFLQNGYAGQAGAVPQNPAQQFFQYLSQYPNNGFDFQQNPFANPAQSNAANPLDFFTQWMRQISRNRCGGISPFPFFGFGAKNANGFTDWSQMFQKTFAEQMQRANAHQDAADNPFLGLFTHGSQAQSGGFAKNGFLDPKAIFTHWSQQIPWEYFWTEIRKNNIFGINGMIPPNACGAFSSAGNRKSKDGADSRKISPLSPLIKMKESGSRNPFFCVHALLGSSFHFHFLANQMDQEQPFYALQAPGLGSADDDVPIDDIEEFASLYIKTIRIVQKKGPYFLGGYSFGGWIAFEMARQLLKEGEEVGLIAIFGASVPFSVLNPSLFEEIRLYDQFMEDYNTTIIHPFLPPEERKPLSYHKDKMNEKLTPLQRVMKAHTNAIISYLPYPCDAKVTLFETLDLQLVYPYDYARGWNRLTSQEVEVHQITGNHLSMLEEPHIKILGEKLRHCLRKANELE